MIIIHCFYLINPIIYCNVQFSQLTPKPLTPQPLTPEPLTLNLSYPAQLSLSRSRVTSLANSPKRTNSRTKDFDIVDGVDKSCI
jgi:hypothetical protein